MGPGATPRTTTVEPSSTAIADRTSCAEVASCPSTAAEHPPVI
jgi:hypothetical protein